MSEILTLADAKQISDPTEQLFAIAFLHLFPHLPLSHSCTIVAHSGKRIRQTRPDFKISNTAGECLYIEIASGDKLTGRKAKQHKTARLAGLGDRHVTFYGSEVRSLGDQDTATMRQLFFQLLFQRFSPQLFDFS